MTFAAEHQFESAEALAAFGAELSLFASPGMVILLQGGLGAGKSTLARSFIRSLAVAGRDFDVPSPTFTLVQTYDETRIPVAHADLYRLTSDAECDELGLEQLLAAHVLLVEWPERLLGRTWKDVLMIELTGRGNRRALQLQANGTWEVALRRNAAIKSFLESTPWRNAARTFLEGDASFRRYETLRRDGAAAILMDMQARPDGPPVRGGKPYSAIAHLAEDIRAVVGINAELVARGYSAPRTEACDLQQGFAIIEDLGRNVYGRMMQDGADMGEPMHEAVALLADMAARDWSAAAPLGNGETHRLSPYDLDAQLIEIDLLPSWFWPHIHGTSIPAEVRAEFESLWTSLLPAAVPEKPVWTLRDYHSPNLLWLPERAGLRRVGLIDTQDAVLGHPAYDLVSLLQDARVDIPFETADGLFAAYCNLRQSQGRFNREAFAISFALLGAQRATKILGIFARLSKRDGKHGYLRHVPRVSRYLERNLQHGALAPLRAWFDRHLPAEVRINVA